MLSNTEITEIGKEHLKVGYNRDSCEVEIEIAPFALELERRARDAALEEAAHLIETHQETTTGNAKTLGKRPEGDSQGLAFAAAIRALKVTP